MPSTKYLDIYRSLRQRIVSGEFKDTGLLPSENTLIRQFACSRNTVRRAIANLTDDGYVQVQHGKRVQILSAPRFPALFSVGGIESFREAAERNGISRYSTRILSFEEDILTPEEATVTGMPEGSAVYRIKRLRSIDGEPRILDYNIFLKSEAAGLNRADAEKSIYDYLENTLGMQITSGRRTITAETASAEDCQYLGLQDKGFVFIVTSQTFNGKGILFEYTQSRHSPEHFVFVEKSVRRKI
ncbi:MAG: GntR family transcriptional regulator [Clostridia bacterium]|nr:GntR family transcriptional regulator [Clostridia bacterium]